MTMANRRLMPIIALTVLSLLVALVGGSTPAAQGAEQPVKVIAYAGNKQTTPITAPFVSLLEARVLAADGQPVPGIEVTFQLPADGRGASFDLPGVQLEATAPTDVNGIARSPGFTANSSSGSWRATASVDGVLDQALFNLGNSPANTGIAVYSTPDSSRPGQPVSFTAVIGSSPSSAGVPSGSIFFEADGDQIGQPVPLAADGTAVSQAKVFGPGDVGGHVIEASFAAGANYGSSEGGTTHDVSQGTAHVEVSNSPAPSAPGDPVDLVATVAAVAPAAGQPTGSVQFQIDGNDLGSPVSLTGGTAQAQFTGSTSGAHVVRALYSGDDSFRAARGVSVQSVGPQATSTSTSLSPSDPDPVFGSPVTLTAQVSGASPPVGEVTFSASSQEDGTFELCSDVTVISGQAGCEIDPPLEAGEYEFSAAFQSGGLGVDPSEDRLILDVLEAPVGMEIDANPDPAVFGAGFGLSGAVTAGTGSVDDLSGAVVFKAGEVPIGDPVPLVDGQADVSPAATGNLGAGPQPVTATYGGDRDFLDASAATVVPVAPVDTYLALTSSNNPVAFGKPVSLTANVDALGDIPGGLAGSVQFWADGANRGGLVPVKNGVAQATFAGLESGDHDVRAYFTGTGSFGPSEGALVQTLDSPPPSPNGILPCSNRRIVLTSAYRSGNSVRFEGVARYSLLGLRVQIRQDGHLVALTNVRSDGTFWASAPDPSGRRFKGTDVFQARVNGHRSWNRRLAQPVSIRKRLTPGTKRRGGARVRIETTGHVRSRLTVVRQTGCRKVLAKPIKRVVTSREGIQVLNLPRPAKGTPYAIYRVRATGGRISSPIIVRSPR